MAYGINFLPGGDEQSGDPRDPRGGRLGGRIQEAVRLLNLRLPRVQGGGSPVPNALLQSRGGQPGMDSAMNLQALQRALMAMAGMGRNPADLVSAAQRSSQGYNPNVSFGQGLPPGMPDPGISPPGPGNLPPMAPPMSPPIVEVNPPGPPNLPRVTVARSHGGKNDPMADFLRRNGTRPTPRVISPPGPGNLPRGNVVSHGPGSGARPTAPITIPNPRKSLPRTGPQPKPLPRVRFVSM